MSRRFIVFKETDYNILIAKIINSIVELKDDDRGYTVHSVRTGQELDDITFRSILLDCIDQVLSSEWK